MADIIMRSILSAIKSDYPKIKFKVGDQYYWSPSLQTVFYAPLNNGSIDNVLLIHELSHAILNHSSYKKDIDLLKIERQAWDKTLELASAYNVRVNTTEANDALDSYRDWLHNRSVCPTCSAIGLEVDNKEYSCVACGAKWRPNEARICQLKRYKIK